MSTPNNTIGIGTEVLKAIVAVREAIIYSEDEGSDSISAVLVEAEVLLKKAAKLNLDCDRERE